jgi:hypothetical protein
MSRVRFTIAQLMLVVFYCAFGFAALRNATTLWASASFSLAIISVSVAFVGACARKKKDRMSWAGFATAGAARLVTWLVAALPAGSWPVLPQPLLYGFRPYINPAASGGAPFIAYVQTCYSLDVILLGLVAAALGHFVAVKDDRPNGS